MLLSSSGLPDASTIRILRDQSARSRRAISSDAIRVAPHHVGRLAARARAENR